MADLLLDKKPVTDQTLKELKESATVITDLAKDWYPNEYHFVSEQFFNSLLRLKGCLKELV